jgi:phosphotransferase system IIB component
MFINAFTISRIYLIIGAIIALVIIVSVILLIVINKKPKKQLNMDFILTLFSKENIVKVDFIRNKIVIDFKDVEIVDVNALHEKGAEGISIIGDRIKFYFDGGEEKNLAIFNQIKSFIEG